MILIGVTPRSRLLGRPEPSLRRGLGWMPAILTGILLSTSAAAQVQECVEVSSYHVFTNRDGNEADQPNACSNNLPCYKAAVGGPQHSLTSPVELRVPVTALGSHQAGPGGHLRIFWFNAGKPTMPCDLPPGCTNLIAICGASRARSPRTTQTPTSRKAPPAPTGLAPAEPSRSRRTPARAGDHARGVRIPPRWTLGPWLSAGFSAASLHPLLAAAEITPAATVSA